MAPSPAAGKAGGAPRTPTKLGRKPQSQQTSKLGDSASKSTQPSTPKASEVSKPETDTPQPPRPSEDDAKEKTDDAGKKGEEASKVEMKDESEAATSVADDGDDDEDTPAGKVSQAGRDLEEQDPKPIDDAEDATAGAQESAEDVDDDADDTPDDATEKAGDTAEDLEDTAEETESAEDETSGPSSGVKGTASKAGEKAKKSTDEPTGDAEDTVEDAEDAAEDTAEDAKATAEDAAEDADETAEDAKDTAEDTEDTPEETTKDTEKSASKSKDTAKDTDEDAEDTAETTGEDAEDTVDETVKGGEDTVEDGVDGAKDSAEEKTEENAPDVPDLSILKGLEVGEDGQVLDKEGNPVGKLAEGDAEDLAGYTIGDDGEILDDDGDLVGRCELLPEKTQESKDEAEAEGKAEDPTDGPRMPDVSILKGLTVDRAGQVINEDGDTVGQLVEGDPEELEGMEINEFGEILDEDGDLVGRVELHPDAANLVDQDEEAGKDDEDGETGEAGEAVDDVKEKAEEAGEAVDGVKDNAEEAGEAVDGIKETAEDALPGIEALAGQEVNEEGQIVDDDGNVLATLEEGVDLEKAKGMEVNEQGEVVDEEGNVIGKLNLAEGAEERLAEAAGLVSVDLRILDGLKVNKKGKVLDEEGEVIGELTEGEAKDCAGKLVNDKGEVVDKDGKVVGKVSVVPGEAADEAMKVLHEKLSETKAKEEPKEFIPNLDILDGLKVNKKGKILNEDGEEIGELVDGELKDCAGKKCNAKGEVLNSEGDVIGRVKCLPQTPEEGDEVDEAEGAKEGADNAAEGAEGAVEDAEGAVEDAEGVAEDAEGAAEDAEGAAEDAEGAAEDAEGAAEDAEVDAGPELPPLSVLEGLKVNKSGKIVDDKGVIVGELTEGDAKKLSKSGITCDAEGQFWDSKGHVIGRAKTVPVEDPDEEAPFAGLEGLIVVKDGKVEDENGNTVGVVVEGDAKKLIGRSVDEDGDIIDKKGSVVGHAERYEEPDPEEEPEPEAIDLSILKGKVLNKQGNVIGDEGVPIARLVEGNVKELAGRKLDENGQIWNDSGKVIGRCELIPENERGIKPEGIFAGLEGLRVVADGKIADENDNIVGMIVEGNPKRLVGLAVDEDGDILDRYGNVKGHAEPLPEEEEPEAADLSILDGKTLNKQGFVVGDDGVPVGRLVEGNLPDLAGRKCDGEGQIHNDTGKVVGRCELIPENERVAKAEGPFAGYEGLKIVKDGYVEDVNGNVVGVLTEGDPKRLIGHAVDEDGDIIDRHGNVKGHAEPYAEEETPEIDTSMLAGCTVNKAGNVVDANGATVGRVVEGDPSTMIGKKVDGKGQIWDNAGNVIGKAEPVQGANSGPEGPFAGFDSATVVKDGTVQTPDGSIVGRVIEGDIKKLVGHKVDEDGDITDKNGNTIGKAERWEPEEKERRINPMSGRRVNKEGEIRDEDGNILGRLTAGDLGHCVGLEIDDNGYVVDNDGNRVGEATLLENIAVEEEEEEEEMTEEERKKKEESEVAEKMATICQQTLERVQPVCKQITEHIEKADRTPKEELDEEELVNNVKPLIEEAGRILQECNGSLRGLDPDGHIAAQAKGRAGTREATPEEYRLADCLKELTTTVVTTIDNAKKKISDMPHAKKKLNPLWGLMTQPLFQILAAVGLLLTGVLGLVGQLLNGLGLGGLVNGLLGGLGINKLLSGLGLGGVTDALGGGKKKKAGGGGGGASSLPIVGGLFGGK